MKCALLPQECRYLKQQPIILVIIFDRAHESWIHRRLVTEHRKKVHFEIQIRTVFSIKCLMKAPVKVPKYGQNSAPVIHYFMRRFWCSAMTTALDNSVRFYATRMNLDTKHTEFIPPILNITPLLLHWLTWALRGHVKRQTAQLPDFTIFVCHSLSRPVCPSCDLCGRSDRLAHRAGIFV